MCWAESMVGGNDLPPRCDSTLDFQSLGPQPLWRKTRCSALQRRSSSLTTPSLLSRAGPPLSTLRQAQRAHCAAAMRARAATLIFQRGRCVLSRLLLCNPLNARTAVSLERPRYFSPLSPQLREYVHVIFLGQRLSQDPGNIG